MSRIYRMKPHPKRVIWAGATLGTILGIPPESDEPAIGEALDASGLTEMPSHVSGGKDDGMALNELFEREAPELLGRPKLPKERFPLLVKRLDAKA
ncbi:MAG: mannose-6-phosphate isomerase class I, partial [Planctomycetota bacterium]